MFDPIMPAAPEMTSFSLVKTSYVNFYVIFSCLTKILNSFLIGNFIRKLTLISHRNKGDIRQMAIIKS